MAKEGHDARDFLNILKQNRKNPQKNLQKTRKTNKKKQTKTTKPRVCLISLWYIRTFQDSY